MSTSLLCSKAYQITDAKAYVFFDSVVWEKWEMISSQLGRAEVNGIQKQSLPGFESNLRHADGVRVENISRNHDVESSREDSKSDEKLKV